VLSREARPGPLLLREDAKTIGAQVLRAHEWNAIERRPQAAKTGSEKPDREDDVEGWRRRLRGE
jgi:hypothetical protein